MSKIAPILTTARDATLRYLGPAAALDAVAAKAKDRDKDKHSTRDRLRMTMRKTLTVAALGTTIMLGAERSWALSPETTMLLELLKTKGVITPKEAVDLTNALAETLATDASAENEHHHSVQSRVDRADSLEMKEDKERLVDKIQLSALIETEMTAMRTEEADGTRTKSSDISLATAQISANADINQYVGGRLVFLYEEGVNDDDIAIDEAIIAIKGGNNSPLYTNIGHQYVPFGRFESHFISDPGPLTLGETNDTAVVAGFANDIAEFSLGAFKGKVKETGKSDHINSAVASVTLTKPDADQDGLSLSCGISYLSNLATSDSLEAETTASEVVDMVGGWSSFISLDYGDRFFFDAEYLGAVNDFAITDFSFTDEENLSPEAWNLEVAARIYEKAELAFRYGGSNGTRAFLAEDEYGIALLYNLFRSTNVTVEYLRQKFMNSGDNNQGAIQLAVEF